MDVRGERQTDRHCIIEGWQAEEDEDVDIEFSQEDVDGADEAGNQAAAAAVAPSLTGVAAQDVNFSGVDSFTAFGPEQHTFGPSQNREWCRVDDVNLDALVERRSSSWKKRELESHCSLRQFDQCLGSLKQSSDRNANEAHRGFASEALEESQGHNHMITMQGNSSFKRVSAREFPSKRVGKSIHSRSLASQSESASVSWVDSKEAVVEKSDEKEDAKRRKSVQIVEKWKGIEMEHPSSARIKRGTRNNDMIPWSVMNLLPGKRPVDIKSKDASVDNEKRGSLAKRKERLKEKQMEIQEKTKNLAGKEKEVSLMRFNGKVVRSVEDRSLQDRRKNGKLLGKRKCDSQSSFAAEEEVRKKKGREHDQKEQELHENPLNGKRRGVVSPWNSKERSPKKCRRQVNRGDIDEDGAEDSREQEEVQWRAGQKLDGKGKKASGAKALPPDLGKEKFAAYNITGSAKCRRLPGQDFQNDNPQEYLHYPEEGASAAPSSKSSDKAKKHLVVDIFSGMGDTIGDNLPQVDGQRSIPGHVSDCNVMRKVSVKTNTKEKVAGCVHDVPDAENCKGAKDSERQMEPLPNVEEDGSNETLVHRRLVWIKDLLLCSNTVWNIRLDNMTGFRAWVECTKVDEDGLWWPAKLVAEKEVPLKILKQISIGKGKFVSLFHPEKGLQQFQTVRRSCMRPFEPFYDSCKSLKASPDFKAAVNEAHNLLCTHSALGVSLGSTRCEGDKPIPVEKDNAAEGEVPVFEGSQSSKFRDGGIHTKKQIVLACFAKSSSTSKCEGDNNSLQRSATGIMEEAMDECEKCEEKSGGEGYIQETESTGEIHEVGYDIESRVKVRTGILIPNKDVSEKRKSAEDREVTDADKGHPMAENVHLDNRKVQLDIEILPGKRILAYDIPNEELCLQNGTVLKIDSQSLGEALSKNNTGNIPHDCIRKVGVSNVRSRFPKSGKSSKGLEFATLNQSSEFAKRLKDTWVREYDGDEFPEFLRMKFVAACMAEEQGYVVNWAMEHSRTLSKGLKYVAWGEKPGLSFAYHRFLVELLQKVEGGRGDSCKHGQCDHQVQSPHLVDAKCQEEKLDLAESNPLCQQCKIGGELLNIRIVCSWCGSRSCRKTYHLKCLDPPLDDTRHANFFCPSCSKNGLVEKPPVSQGEKGCDQHKEQENGMARIGSSGEGENGDVTHKAGAATLVVARKDFVVEFDVGNDDDIGTVQKLCKPPDSTSGLQPSEIRRSSPIQLVNKDERSGSRCETSLLQAGCRDVSFVSSEALSADAELEEGEIAPIRRFRSCEAPEKAPEDLLKMHSTGTSPVINQRMVCSSEIAVDRHTTKENKGDQSQPEESPTSDEHNSVCEECETGGELILCDGQGCRNVYHKECLVPPLAAVPAGEWFCSSCQMKRKGSVVEKIWGMREVATGALPTESIGWKSGTCHGVSHAETVDEDAEEDEDENLPLSAIFCRDSRGFGSERDGMDIDPDLSKVGNKTRLQLEDLHSQLEAEAVGGKEYFVQWKSYSHAHNKWVPERELEQLAPKELARFKKSATQGRVEEWESDWAQPQRVIQKRFMVQSEQLPERCLCPQDEDCRVEWYVKWKGLGYEHCTWEAMDRGVLATPIAARLFSDFKNWEDAARQRTTPESAKEAERLRKNPFVSVESQPGWNSFEPSPPNQPDALNHVCGWWRSHKNGILVYEASQEKIVTTALFVRTLVKGFQVVHPILIVVNVALVQSWERELHLWASDVNVVNYASKNEEAREIIRQVEFNLNSGLFKPEVVLTTFEVFNYDMEILKNLEWEALIVDEGWRLHPQKTYHPFSRLNSAFRLLLLSEPPKANIVELSQVVGFLEPDKSLLIHGHNEAADMTELQTALNGRLLEYVQNNCLREYWVPVEMTPLHLRQYCDILVQNYPNLVRNRRDHFSSQIPDVVVKLRQSCNHPFLADPTLEGRMGHNLSPKEILNAHIQISGKMQLLHLMLPILKKTGRRILIVSQETRQLDILDKYMLQLFGADSYERVDSDVAVNRKQLAIQRFNSEASKHFVFLLKTGVHIVLRDVQLAIIYDSDGNPSNDTRALKKVHNEGEGGSRPLTVFRLYTRLSVEESVLILAHDKKMPMVFSSAPINSKACHKVLMRCAIELFQRYDEEVSSVSGQIENRCKGDISQDALPKGTIGRVIYDAERVETLLDAAFTLESFLKDIQDELLQAILMPRDKKAPFFRDYEGEPFKMDDGESVERFWAPILKWRYEDWQAKEVKALGKGHRERKRVTYSEGVLASAAYSKPQVAEDQEGCQRRRRRPTSDDGAHEIDSGNVVSADMLPLHAETNQVATQHNTLKEEVPKPAVTTEARDGGHETPTNPTITVLRDKTVAGVDQQERRIAGLRKSNIHATKSLLTTLCQTLQFAENVTTHAHLLLGHIIQVKPECFAAETPREGKIAFALAVCWLAADDLLVVVDKSQSIVKTEAAMNVMYDHSHLEQFYSMVKGVCESFRRPFAVQLAIAGAADLISIPLPQTQASIMRSRASVQKLGPDPTAEKDPPKSITKLESSSQAQLSQAKVVEPAGASKELDVPRVVLPQHLLDAEIEVRLVVSESPTESVKVSGMPASCSVLQQEPETLPQDQLHNLQVSTPADTVCVLAEAQGVGVQLALEGTQNQQPSPKSSSEQQGLQSQQTSLPSKVPKPISLVCAVESPAAVQGLSAPVHAPEVPMPITELDADLHPSPPTSQASVSETVETPPTDLHSVHGGQAEPRLPHALTTSCHTSHQLPEPQMVPLSSQVSPCDLQTENPQLLPMPDTPALLLEKLQADKVVFLTGQAKEVEQFGQRSDSELAELKRRLDSACASIRATHPNPESMIRAQLSLYDIDSRTLVRQSAEQRKALETQQHADRDKLTELHRMQTKLANGVPSENVTTLSAAVNTLREYYKGLLTPRPQAAASCNRVQLPQGNQASQASLQQYPQVLPQGRHQANEFGSQQSAPSQQRQHESQTCVGGSASPAALEPGSGAYCQTLCSPQGNAASQAYSRLQPQILPQNRGQANGHGTQNSVTTQQRQHPTTHTHVSNSASVARYQPGPAAAHDRLPSPLGNVGSQASRLHPQILSQNRGHANRGVTQPSTPTHQRHYLGTQTNFVNNSTSVARLQPSPAASQDRLPSPQGNLALQASSDLLHPQSFPQSRGQANGCGIQPSASTWQGQHPGTFVGNSALAATSQCAPAASSDRLVSLQSNVASQASPPLHQQMQNRSPVNGCETQQSASLAASLSAEAMHMLNENHIARRDSVPNNQWTPQVQTLPAVTNITSTASQNLPGPVTEFNQSMQTRPMTVSVTPAAVYCPLSVLTQADGDQIIQTAPMSITVTSTGGQNPLSVVPQTAGQNGSQPHSGQHQRGHQVSQVGLYQSGQQQGQTMSRGPFASTVSVGAAPRGPSHALTAGVPRSLPDPLLREQEKLKREVEKLKHGYEEEAKKIKAEYTREAEVIHKKYESLLLKEHHSFSLRHQELQRNIAKVDCNRQLVEALKVREDCVLQPDVAVRVGAVPNSMMGQQQGPSFFSPQQPCQQSSSVGQMQGGHTPVSRPSNYATQCVSMFSNPLLSQGSTGMVIGHPVVNVSNRMATGSYTAVGSPTVPATAPPPQLNLSYPSVFEVMHWNTGHPAGSNGMSLSSVPLSRAAHQNPMQHGTITSNGTFQMEVPRQTDFLLSSEIQRQASGMNRTTSVPIMAGGASPSTVPNVSQTPVAVPTVASPREATTFFHGVTRESQTPPSDFPSPVHLPLVNSASAPVQERPMSVIYLTDSDEEE